VSAKVQTFLRRVAAATDGATALEFAMVLPVFVAIMFGTFQFGLAQHNLSSLRYALGGASRTLMLNPTMTQTQVSNLVKANLQDIADPNVTVTMATFTSGSGKIARLTGVYSSYIGIPMVATYPLNFTTTVDTALPNI
jgi:Flp pilus assembly protein TadG